VSAAAAALPGCGSSDSGGTGAAAGAPGAAGAAGGPGAAGAAAAGAPGLLPGDVTRGMTAYNAPAAGAALTAPGGACYTCHGSAGQGEHGPNITFAMGTTLGGGIGTWTFQQFHDAVRLGKNKDGSALCALMAPVPATGPASASEQDITDIYAYLKSVPPSTTALQGDYCPTG
jgi:hypothetical protein